MNNNENNSDDPIEEKYDSEKDYKAWEVGEIITDLTLGRSPRYPADTKEKKAKIKRLQKEIDDAKSKGHMIIVPD